MVIHKQSLANVPLPLMGPQNLRELGGYPTCFGTETAKARLLRSDSLDYLTCSDREALYRYGVRCVIDLRSETEQRLRPDHFDEYPEIKCHHVPMFDRILLSNGTQREPNDLTELYIRLLDNAGDSFCRVMHTIAGVENGCVLFHCAAGKDRTGLVSMLLLMLAGVPEDLIVADYASSCDNMAVIFAYQKLEMHAMGKPVNELLFRSSPRDIGAAIGHIYTRYGDAEGYLRTAGCSQQVLDSLHRKLLEGRTSALAG